MNLICLTLTLSEKRAIIASKAFSGKERAKEDSFFPQGEKMKKSRRALLSVILEI